MKVNEIFKSIQGEGIYIGTPMLFVRLTGCNLRCKWCDTKYAYTEGEEWKLEDLLKKIEKKNMEWVCITGGEPLIQDETYLLVDALLRKGHKVLIETNGSVDISKLPTEENLVVSLDIKTPSSGMHNFNQFKNLDYLGPNDYVKFVIADETDFEYAVKIINTRDIKTEIVFQPLWGTDMEKLVMMVLDANLNVRVLPQLHKMIWGEKRGV